MTALPAASNSASALDDLDALNAQLEPLRADERVAWALQHGPQEAALSSSFGAQSAVTLHLLSQQRPGIPVILIDTGYLFPETYRFADALTDRLKLNLKVYRPLVSRAWMEARHGRLWEQGMVGIDQYNNLRKVEPMRRALDEAQRRHLVHRPAPQPVARPCADPDPAEARRPLQDQPHRRLDRPRRLAIPAGPRPALPPAMGAGLRLHRRFPHHPPLGARHARGRHALFRGLKRECGIHEDI